MRSGEVLFHLRLGHNSLISWKFELWQNFQLATKNGINQGNQDTCTVIQEEMESARFYLPSVTVLVLTTEVWTLLGLPIENEPIKLVLAFCCRMSASESICRRSCPWSSAVHYDRFGVVTEFLSQTQLGPSVLPLSQMAFYIKLLQLSQADSVAC